MRRIHQEELAKEEEVDNEKIILLEKKRLFSPGKRDKSWSIVPSSHHYYRTIGSRISFCVLLILVTVSYFSAINLTNKYSRIIDGCDIASKTMATRSSSQPLPPQSRTTATTDIHTNTINQNAEDFDGCWRRCPPVRVNNIIVNFHAQAGLNDRFYIMDRLGSLAGYLCANLHVSILINRDFYPV
jgi:hypothetical protein